MNKIMNITKKLAKDEDGAVMVEYALLVALIALAAITAITLLGTTIAELFTHIANTLGEQVPDGG